jgi:hypothetical protein
MSFLGVQFGGDDDSQHSELVENIPQNSSVQSQNSAVSAGGSYRINTEADGEREMTEAEVNKLVHDALRRARKATTPKRRTTALSPFSITSSQSSMGGASPSMKSDSRAFDYTPSNLDQLIMSNSSDPSHTHMHALLPPTMDSLAEDSVMIQNVNSFMNTSSSDSVLRKVEEETANARKAPLESTQNLKHLATPQGSMDDAYTSPPDNFADILHDQFRDEDLHNILDTNDSEDQLDEAMNDMGSEFANGTPTKDQVSRMVTSPVDTAAPVRFGYQPEPGTVEDGVDESLEISLDESQKYRSAAVSPENNAIPLVHQPPVLLSQESPCMTASIHDNHAAAYVEEGEGVEAIDHVLQSIPSIVNEGDEKKSDSPSSRRKISSPVSQVESSMSQASNTKSSAEKDGNAEQSDDKSESFRTAHSEEGKVAAAAAVPVEEEAAIEVKPTSSDTHEIVNQSDSDFIEVTVAEDEITRIGSTVVMFSEPSDCTKEEEIIEDGDSEYTEETVEEAEETTEEKEEEPSAREVTIEGVPERGSPEKASPLKKSPVKVSPQKTSPQKTMAVAKSESESSDPLEPQEKENTPATPKIAIAASSVFKAKPTSLGVFKAKPTSLAVDTNTEKIKFRHPYPYPPPLPKPRPASVIMKENETGIPNQFTTWSDAKPDLEQLLLAACGDSLPRRSNACGALKVLSQKKKNQLALVRTKGFLDAIVFAVSATIPNNHDTEIALNARGRAVSTLLNVAVPKDNRALVLVHPGVVECLLKVIEDDQGEARVEACATLATLAKTPGNRECMAKTDGLLDVLASVLIGSSMNDEGFESSMDEDEEKKEEDTSAEFEDEEGNTSAEGFGSTSFSTNNTDGEGGTNFDDDGMSLGVSSSMSSIQPPGKGRANHKSIRSQKDELHELFLKQARVNACAALMHLSKQCAISVSLIIPNVLLLFVRQC